MKLKKTITAAVIAVAALTGTLAQAAPEKAPVSDKAGAEAAGAMKYYQHKDAAAPGKAGAGVAPERSAPGIAPQGAARGMGDGSARKQIDHRFWPSPYGNPGYTELLYQEEATIFGMRDRWVERFQQHSVVIERRGDVFEGYVVKQYGWRQYTVPLFRITTDMIYDGYVYYGQPYSYRTGPYTLTVQLGDLILRGNRVQGMNFLVTLEREYNRYSNYYNGPGYPPYGGPHGGYGRSAPGVTPMDAPGRAGAKAEPEKAAPGKSGASAAPEKGKTDEKDKGEAF